ncbi:Caspase domain, partial [Rhizoctonia solani]
MSVIPTDNQSSVIIIPRDIASATNDRGSSHPERTIMEANLLKAVQLGDNIHTGNSAPPDPVERRALLISAQYKEFRWGILDGPPFDTYAVYNMLVEVFDYRPENIRILCDVSGVDPKSGSFPTKDNIVNQIKLKSLEWLTSNVRSGDYRFMHYSGHGGHFLSNDKDGKQLRRPGIDKWGEDSWDPKVEPRKGDTERTPSQITAGRITEIKVLLQDLEYYKQGIVTGSNDVNPKMEDSNCLIFDKAHLRTKVEGAGFRAIDDESSQIPSTDGWSREGDVIQQAELSILKSEELKGGSEGDSKTVTSGPRFFSKLLGAVGIGGADVTLHEVLPDREKQMDHTKPYVVRCWTAAHSRQESWDTAFGGTFTAVSRSSVPFFFIHQDFQSFIANCRKFRNSPNWSKEFTYRRLYEQVSSEITNIQKASIWNLKSGPNPQFVQLWSSLPDDTQGSKDDLLNSTVIL